MVLQEESLRRCARAATGPELQSLVEALDDFIWFTLSQKPLRSLLHGEYPLCYHVDATTETAFGAWFEDFPQEIMCSQAFKAYCILKEMC